MSLRSLDPLSMLARPLGVEIRHGSTHSLGRCTCRICLARLTVSPPHIVPLLCRFTFCTDRLGVGSALRKTVRQNHIVFEHSSWATAPSHGAPSIGNPSVTVDLERDSFSVRRVLILSKGRTSTVSQ